MPTSVVLFVALLFTWEGVSSQEASNWSCTNYGYGPDNGPSKWPDFCPACGQPNQSPIFIDFDEVVEIGSVRLRGKFFQLGTAYVPPVTEEYVLINDGKTVNLKVFGSEDHCINGDLLDGEYCFDHLQIRWGANDSGGSEHKYGEFSKYGLERQWGFYSKKYDSYEEASKHEKGIMRMAEPIVLVTDDDDDFMKPIMDYLPTVTGQYKYPTEKILHKWLLPKTLFLKIFYEGSLNTPPCTGGVLWVIYPAQKGVTPSQLAELRKLMSPDGEPLLDNRRPLQPHDSNTTWVPHRWMLKDRYWPYAGGSQETATTSRRRASRRHGVPHRH